ncbi:hypothetical protein [Vibrio maerlii]|uniref:hypothetical protein n=1 Tax=Vibrio maerlii TaxID=2231648 RepID=UPI000E3D3C07|nr:hypothetical protein [Vibrio maerlii]
MSIGNFNPIRDALDDTKGTYSSSDLDSNHYSYSDNLQPLDIVDLQTYAAANSFTEFQSIHIVSRLEESVEDRRTRYDCINTKIEPNQVKFHLSSTQIKQSLGLELNDQEQIHNLQYSGNAGKLVENNTITFSGNGLGQIKLADTLESYDAFTIEFSYQSTGEHQGLIENIFGVSNDHQHTQGISLYVLNKTGGLGIDFDSDSRVAFEEINVNDGQQHNLVITWDSKDGKLLLFDNHQQIASACLSQGLVIKEGSLAVLGSEYEHLELCDEEKPITNIEIQSFTMAYESIDPNLILKGTPLSQISSDLAFDLQVRNGKLIDLANDSFVSISDDVSIQKSYDFYPNYEFKGIISLTYTPGNKEIDNQDT